ncbi:MAG TPA: hypothetical protein VMH06_02410 [Thermodesulfovibrionales bacterium]|nr:hypothetical protein [Thermodesulfovibrionales bacterium]
MCPHYKEGVCEAAGIEPEAIICVKTDRCTNRAWEQCSVYISLFFFTTGLAFRRVA